MIKKKRLKFSKLVSNILVLSGVFQMTVLQIHIRMINNLFSAIIGFYLFAFILFTIINILNGANFSAKKSVLSIITIYSITGIQIFIGALFISVTLNEVATIAEVSMTNDTRLSILFLIISMGASVIACITSVIFYFRKTELDMYLG